MKLLLIGLISIFFAMNANAVDSKKESEKTQKIKTVCLDVQGKDGKPVIDPKTNKPKQNCTKVRVHKKFEGSNIDKAKKQ